VTTRDWDATTYDRVSAPQQKWAAEQLNRLQLSGDEVVLDAGCGSGKITLELARRVPRGIVYAVDAAPSMVAHTQEALGDRAIVSCQDLAQLGLPEPVDVVFSNATFHWIPDHDALFAALHRNMKPGGRLLAQCGGRGNIDTFRRLADEVAGEAPFAEYFGDWVRPFIATVCLVRHLDPLPDDLRERFVDTVMDRLDRPVVLEYVRLNMTATAAA
jgi:trans-aconitate 2-methyltransferase